MMQNFESFGKEKIEKLGEYLQKADIICPLSPVNAGAGKALTIPMMKTQKGDAAPAFTEEKQCPYPKLLIKSDKFFLSYFYSGRNQSLVLNPGLKEPKEIYFHELSALIGKIKSLSSNIDSCKALNECDFHLAAWTAIVREKNMENTLSAMINLGFYDDAEKLAENIKGDAARIYAARIKRGRGDIKGAGEEIAAIKDEALKSQKYIQYAWLLYLSGKYAEAEKIFSAFENSQFAQESMYGCALCLLKMDGQNAQIVKEKLKKAAQLPGENKINVNAVLGGICLKEKNFLAAIDFYSKAYAANGSLHFLCSIGTALAMKGDYKDAYDIAFSCAPFNVNFAAKIFSHISPDFLSKASYSGNQILYKPKEELTPEKIIIEREKDPPPPPAPAAASLEPADISKRVAKPSIAKAGESKIEFESNIPETYFSHSQGKASQVSDEEKSAFISRAFSLCSRLEEEYNKKIFFNVEGLSDVERDLRLFFIQRNINPSQLAERVRDAGAFVCYMLKERYKAKIVELKDFDEWAWPCIINYQEKELVTYPVARVWNIIWHNALPDQGWALKYFQYISGEISSQTQASFGAAAVKNRIKSHPEKIFDAEIEHKRIFSLAQSLEELSHIETARSGILKIDRELKKRFKPEIPPTADGWRLLRCCAHLLAEIIIKDFKASWFNVEGNDGFWSLEMPWKTYVFPIGKTFKAASAGENLSVFYDNLMAEKLRQGKI